MTFWTPSSLSVAGSTAVRPGGKPMAPVATIVPWPGIRRGTLATVPMPPGFVRLMLAP